MPHAFRSRTDEDLLSDTDEATCSSLSLHRHFITVVKWSYSHLLQLRWNDPLNTIKAESVTGRMPILVLRVREVILSSVDEVASTICKTGKEGHPSATFFQSSGSLAVGNQIR